MAVGTKHEALVSFTDYVRPASLEVSLTHPKLFLGWVVVVEVEDIGMKLTTTSFTLSTFVFHKIYLALLHQLTGSD